ncbi:DUF1016 family protein [Treponema rectale]|uniref:DUF1016 family protein n=1 Tax=Treponema rectale TaxID=744512 RepID=A0A7M1XIH7_9SPIR|nr:DUF1016 family protein [Treponema rectale]
MEQKEYFDDLIKIKETITENRNKAMVVVNSAMIITYYQIGTIINQRKAWGNRYIKMLASDLKEYGKGYSTDQLKRMARFASYFSESEISAQAVHQIPWSTIIELMRLSSSKEEALWYVGQIVKNRWSRAIVIKQFELQAYQRQNILPAVSDENSYIQGIIKDTLAFDFISKNEVTDEKSLKDKLVDNIILFLQELGTGFALVGREYKLVTPTGKNFFIDLLMYHTKVHAYVVIEVKLEDITPADFGQLNFYVNAIDDLEKTKTDNETIGILLCKTADNYVVETSFKGLKTPIGVSKYKLFEDLPAYLANKLNSIDKTEDNDSSLKLISDSKEGKDTK